MIKTLLDQVEEDVEKTALEKMEDANVSVLNLSQVP
jgi:hypothetical protein